MIIRSVLDSKLTASYDQHTLQMGKHEWQSPELTGLDRKVWDG